GLRRVAERPPAFVAVSDVTIRRLLRLDVGGVIAPLGPALAGGLDAIEHEEQVRFDVYQDARDRLDLRLWRIRIPEIRAGSRQERAVGEEDDRRDLILLQARMPDEASAPLIDVVDDDAVAGGGTAAVLARPARFQDDLVSALAQDERPLIDRAVSPV